MDKVFAERLWGLEFGFQHQLKIWAGYWLERGRSQGWLVSQLKHRALASEKCCLKKSNEEGQKHIWPASIWLSYVVRRQAQLNTHIPTSHTHVCFVSFCLFVLPWWIEPSIHSCRQAQYSWAAFLAQFNFWLAYNNLYSFMRYRVVFLYIHTACYDRIKVVKHIHGLKHLLFLNHSKSFIAILKYMLLLAIVTLVCK